MIVTTMSDEGYTDYGKRALESWLEFTPYQIHVYYENKPFFEHERITYHRFSDIPDAINFLNKIGKNLQFKGIEKTDKGDIYNYMRDAYKFCRKTFVVADFGLSTKETFMWLDADVIAKKGIGDKFIKNLLEDYYIAYLGRPWSYSECGFMAFDCSREESDMFFSLYRNFYVNGGFTHLNYWTDCHGFDLVKTLIGAQCNDLAIGLKSNHPFVDSILGEFFDHLKGPERKKLGYSPERKQ